MADKTGNLQDRGDMRFQDKPFGSPGLCPFKGADIAIVPVRYALDRSHHDPDPSILKPLHKDGVWTDLPDLISRKYTLRQLYEGYVYVFDETAKTFHEYSYTVTDSLLNKVKWLEQDIGQDQRSTMTGESKAFLLYPRTHKLHIGYSTKQWTWRICEHMRSNPGSRALWMKALDLNGYCRTMAERDTYPLDQMAEAVADVDHLIQANVAVSKRSLPFLPVELTNEPVQKAFEENGQFVSTAKFGAVSNNPYRYDPNTSTYPAMPPGNEDVIWQTWVPFNHDADFLELQIWYPTAVLVENKEMRGYLYQISLEKASETTSDGLSNTELSIQKKNRTETILLAVTE